MTLLRFSHSRFSNWEYFRQDEVTLMYVCIHNVNDNSDGPGCMPPLPGEFDVALHT